MIQSLNHTHNTACVCDLIIDNSIDPLFSLSHTGRLGHVAINTDPLSNKHTGTIDVGIDLKEAIFIEAKPLGDRHTSFTLFHCMHTIACCRSYCKIVSYSCLISHLLMHAFSNRQNINVFTET